MTRNLSLIPTLDADENVAGPHAGPHAYAVRPPPAEQVTARAQSGPRTRPLTEWLVEIAIWLGIVLVFSAIAIALYVWIGR